MFYETGRDHNHTVNLLCKVCEASYLLLNQRLACCYIQLLNQLFIKFGIAISAKKTKVMKNNREDIQDSIETRVPSGKWLQTVTAFTYSGSTWIFCRVKVLSMKYRLESRKQPAALTSLKLIWKDRNTSLDTKVRPLRSLVILIFMYAYGTPYRD